MSPMTINYIYNMRPKSDLKLQLVMYDMTFSYIHVIMDYVHRLFTPVLQQSPLFFWTLTSRFNGMPTWSATLHCSNTFGLRFY